MSRTAQSDQPRAAGFFPQTPATSNIIPSSSPAFGTPVHPLPPAMRRPPAVAKPSILPILLPPATLRPLAFRTFTKKHSLTLKSSALQALATFIGRHCGASWREEGLAERVLEEAAKSWKKSGGGVMVDDGKELKDILKQIEETMSGGRIVNPRSGLARENSLEITPSQDDVMSAARLGIRPDTLVREDSQISLGAATMELDIEEEELDRDPRKWLKVIGAFEQPRLIYDVKRKHFEKENSKPSLLPNPAHKTNLFRNRYNLVHQRLLRNESFQAPTQDFGSSRDISATIQQSYKLTPIANLLGRNGTNHLLLGMLTIAPAGTLAISDLTGSIALDVSHAKIVPEDGSWIAPGMIVLVDGMYEEDYNPLGGTLGGGGGVGGTIGGKFVGFTIGGPPCERRQVSLGIGNFNGDAEHTTTGGFGWVDFLGVGSEKAVGVKMRKIEQRLLGRGTDDEAGRGRVIILSDVNLDQPRTLEALRKVFTTYATEPEEQTPMTFVLMGNFVQHAIMARGGSGGSIEYKEYFDALASVLSDFSTLLHSSTFVFVPGDNDGWASSFSAGAATAIPRRAVPEMFTSRIKRAFATANADHGPKADGEAIWTSNPARLSLFGPAHDIVLFRDDMTGRLRRNAVRLGKSAATEGEDDQEESAEDDVPDDVRMAEDQEPIMPAELDGPIEVDGETATATIAGGKNAAGDVPEDLLAARKLVKTILDQGYLSPFRLQSRPVLWDHASALQLYPLPKALVLADSEAPPFCVTYEGCHVMNPGPVIARGKRGVARWVEYDVWRGSGKLREGFF